MDQISLTTKYMIFGYLCGSILFARIAASVFLKEEILTASKDKNPGTANAFVFGGFWCGLLTLLGDLGKGFLPVFLFMRECPDPLFSFACIPVLAAPVFGHIFPLFHHFQGGKGIAVSFGVLLGLFPIWKPVAILIGYFLVFSLILKITPHFHRTMVTYICSAATMYALLGSNGISAGFLLITAIICLRLHLSKEKREKIKVKLL